jgi:hypothetical protein
MAGDEEITNPMVDAWKLHHRERVPVIEIAKEFKVSRQTIYNWLAKVEGILASSGEAGERARDLAAIDEWIADLRAGVDGGEISLDVGAARVLPFFVHRARIIGYEAPRKSAITIEPERKPVRPDLELLAALREELDRVDEHEHEQAEREATDGLLDAH